jgi:hypothetical protein
MFANAPTGRELDIYHRTTPKSRLRGIAVTDVSVYYFMRYSGSGDKELLSERRATLEAIKYRRGEAIIQSQRVVDHTEVDGNGFLIGGASDPSHPELWPQIRSLESRAKSRDGEALQLVEGAEGDRKQMLHRESLELRNQARVLRAQADRIKADNLRNRDSAQGSISYWPPGPLVG